LKKFSKNNPSQQPLQPKGERHEIKKLHFDRTFGGYCYLINVYFQMRRQTGAAKHSAFLEKG
jgi:hypothetical protein